MPPLVRGKQAGYCLRHPDRNRGALFRAAFGRIRAGVPDDETDRGMVLQSFCLMLAEHDQIGDDVTIGGVKLTADGIEG